MPISAWDGQPAGDRADPALREELLLKGEDFHRAVSPKSGFPPERTYCTIEAPISLGFACGKSGRETTAQILPRMRSHSNDYHKPLEYQPLQTGQSNKESWLDLLCVSV